MKYSDERSALFAKHRDVLMSAARQHSETAYGITGYGVLQHFRKANAYVKNARELNRQFVRYLQTRHGKQEDLFQ